METGRSKSALLVHAASRYVRDSKETATSGRIRLLVRQAAEASTSIARSQRLAQEQSARLANCANRAASKIESFANSDLGDVVRSAVGEAIDDGLRRLEGRLLTGDREDSKARLRKIRVERTPDGDSENNAS